MRSLFFIIAAIIAYVLLRGWPEGLHPLMRTCLAVLLLVLGIGIWPRRSRPQGPRAISMRKPNLSDYLAVGMGVLAIECLFVFLLTVTPPRAAQLAITLEALVHPESRSANSSPDSSPSARGQARQGNWLWDRYGRRRLPNGPAAFPPTNQKSSFVRAMHRALACSWTPDPMCGHSRWKATAMRAGESRASIRPPKTIPMMVGSPPKTASSSSRAHRSDRESHHHPRLSPPPPGWTGCPARPAGSPLDQPSQNETDGTGSLPASGRRDTIGLRLSHHLRAPHL